MKPVRAVLASVALLAGSLAGPAAARADVPDCTGLLEATAYVLPVGCSALTGTFHAVYLAYGEGAPARSRDHGHLGAHVGQHPSGQRAGSDAFELDHPESRQGRIHAASFRAIRSFMISVVPP